MQDSCWVWGCFGSCRCRLIATGADFCPRTCTEILWCRSTWWICLRFIVSWLFSVEWPTKTSDKKILHSKNRPRKRDAWPQCLRRGSNAGVCDSNTARPRTWHRNLDYSTESEAERKRLEKPGCSCSKVKAWLVRRSSSIHLRFLNAVLYGEGMTPGLFRTRFVGCYVFPCNLVKLWRSTCKPCDEWLLGIGQKIIICNDRQNQKVIFKLLLRKDRSARNILALNQCILLHLHSVHLHCVEMSRGDEQRCSLQVFLRLTHDNTDKMETRADQIRLYSENEHMWTKLINN